jgi:hypothetical protein
MLSARQSLVSQEVKPADDVSELSVIPSPHLEKHKLEVENLKWQIEYEKKLHDKLSQLLENKVSGLMAQVKRMQKDIDTRRISMDESLELTTA